METKKLCRSTNKMLAGVCAGIAEYLNIDATVVRVVYAALSLFSAGFPGLLLYLILILLMPAKQTEE
ncbi:MAG: PspC domain-containing protein [Paludibacteraceae bacterium]|nr:PspC domain-containing protein [Paludibacteraceae bacterium]